ncbi:MAG: sigma-54-dependent Fis family transcriptional regulator [Desulfuromonadales bacterium]|nr:sigma-54-dependent Fis family transcriptional regulator [Desulfuromonadales bacterium]
MTSKGTVLVVDDDEGARYIATRYLKQLNYHPILAENGLQALKFLAQENVSLILADHIMPELDGLELLNAVRQNHGALPFVIMTAHGSIENAVTLIKKGATDYLLKPLEPDHLQIVIDRALSIHRLDQENVQLKNYLSGKFTFKSIITGSEQMKEALLLAQKATHIPQGTIAIYGESGTGKEMLAQAIHYAGGGLPNNLVAINCAGIPSGLMESELFGHTKGAFTGAERDHPGKFELARGGTLLLDEIGDMPLETQAKLLRVLEERSFERVGSNKKIPLKARIIVATHQNLEKMVENRSFRQDLYFRINGFPIVIPPLRDRERDITLLAGHFFNTFKAHIGHRLPGLSQQAMSAMQNYSWPGNVRELKNCIERAAILAGDEMIEPKHLNIRQNATFGPAGDGLITIQQALDDQLSLEEITEQVLTAALKKCDNNISHAAKLLQIDRKMFYRRKLK